MLTLSNTCIHLNLKGFCFQDIRVLLFEKLENITNMDFVKTKITTTTTTTTKQTTTTTDITRFDGLFVLS